MIKAVLFDMDGTVLDTEPIYNKAWRFAFEKEEREFSEELFSRCIGLPNVRTAELITEHYGDEELFSRCYRIAGGWIYNYKKECGVPLKTGFFELSDFLRENDVKSVIATSTTHNAAVKDLTAAGVIDRFDGIVGGDDVTFGKPSPEPFAKAAELANTAVGECLAVEDSVNGVISATSAGIKCVYIKDLIDISAEVEKKAYKRVNTLDEIIGVIKELA